MYVSSLMLWEWMRSLTKYLVTSIGGVLISYVFDRDNLCTVGQEWDYVEVKRGISASDNDNLNYAQVQVKIILCVI